MKSDLPKVLQPLAGRALLAHVLDRSAVLDAGQVLVVHGYGGSQVCESLQGYEVEWVLQAEQLGTGHAVAQAMPSVPDANTVLVLYGDVPLIEANTLRDLMDRAKTGCLALLSVVLDDPSGYGRIVRDDKDSVTRIVEQKDADETELTISEVNTGILACDAARLRGWLNDLDNDNAQGEYYLTDVIAKAVSDQYPVVAVSAPTEAEVLGVNDKIQLAELEAENRRQKAIALMRDGVTLLDPNRIDIRGNLACGRDVSIDVNAVFEGDVVLGDGVVIETNVVIRNSRLAAGTVVHANTVIEDSEIGPNCELGPFTRVRPGTQLVEDVKLGNFVEIKKSRVGKGSKVNHLSYVGDTGIGERVNVGAGTITCNYDGANKYKTEIGDGAFIGSGVNLVAPVKVGKNATIGAGSTIITDTEPGELTVSRAKQVTVKGWKRPQKQ